MWRREMFFRRILLILILYPNFWAVFGDKKSIHLRASNKFQLSTNTLSASLKKRVVYWIIQYAKLDCITLYAMIVP